MMYNCDGYDSLFYLLCTGPMELKTLTFSCGPDNKQ